MGDGDWKLDDRSCCGSGRMVEDAAVDASAITDRCCRENGNESVVMSVEEAEEEEHDFAPERNYDRKIDLADGKTLLVRYKGSCCDGKQWKAEKRRERGQRLSEAGIEYNINVYEKIAKTAKSQNANENGKKKRMKIKKEEEKEERRGDDGGVASRGMDRIKGVKKMIMKSLMKEGAVEKQKETNRSQSQENKMKNDVNKNKNHEGNKRAGKNSGDNTDQRVEGKKEQSHGRKDQMTGEVEKRTDKNERQRDGEERKIVGDEQKKGGDERKKEKSKNRKGNDGNVNKAKPKKEEVKQEEEEVEYDDDGMPFVAHPRAPFQVWRRDEIEQR